MIIKKYIALLLVAFLIMFSLVGCVQNDDANLENKEEKLSIVTTIFPQYDWVKNILGSHLNDVELTLLLSSGVDLHSFQPAVDDIIKISNCDMFIYAGGESDKWVDDALKEAVNKDMVVISLLDVLGDEAKEEEVMEGMEAEHEHEEGEHHDQEDGEKHEEHNEAPEYDEHVWLSLKNAEIFCNYISDKLCSLDNKNASDYKNNTEKYIESISALDAEYQQAVNSAKQKTLLFADRFPFRYMVDDYNLDYYAAFAGCSAETEASFETVAFLAGKIDELELSNVLKIEGTEHKIAETIIQNTKAKNQQIVTMDSMQSITSKDIEGGTTYLSVMAKNLEALKTVLN